jgi:lysophospholipase L1-like esterase
MIRRQIDMRSEPVRRIVVLGESTAWGYSVSAKEKCWANRVARLIEEYQGEPVELINQGIGSNVITPECPAYPSSHGKAATERVDSDVVALAPDLVILSYGLNDSRGGTTPTVFREAYQELIDRIRNAIDPLLVVVNTFYIKEECFAIAPWNHSDYDVTEVFNLVIKQIAESNNLILADVYSVEVGVDWIIDNDLCHPNDLGHLLVANRVFEAIGRNCTFVARTMPKDTLIREFGQAYGNGPDRPGS